MQDSMLTQNKRSRHTLDNNETYHNESFGIATKQYTDPMLDYLPEINAANELSRVSLRAQNKRGVLSPSEAVHSDEDELNAMVEDAHQSGQGLPETITAKRFNFQINNQYYVQNVSINSDGTVFESKTNT